MKPILLSIFLSVVSLSAHADADADAVYGWWGDARGSVRCYEIDRGYPLGSWVHPSNCTRYGKVRRHGVYRCYRLTNIDIAIGGPVRDRNCWFKPKMN